MLIDHLLKKDVMTFEEFIDRLLSYEETPRSIISASIHLVSRIMKEEKETVVGVKTMSRIQNLNDISESLFTIEELEAIYNTHKDDVDKVITAQLNFSKQTLDVQSNLSSDVSVSAKKAETAITGTTSAVIYDFLH